MQESLPLFVSGDGSDVTVYVVLAALAFLAMCAMMRSARRRHIGSVPQPVADPHATTRWPCEG